MRWPGVPAPVAEARASILKLEAALNAGAGGEPIKDFEPILRHHHSDGVYAREMTIPQGMCIIGKIHKHAHINIISKGRVVVVTPTEKEELVGPCTFISKPGTKRAVYALEETIWTTIHPNPRNTQDIGLLEEQVIAPTFEHYDALLEHQEQNLLECKV